MSEPKKSAKNTKPKPPLTVPEAVKQAYRDAGHGNSKGKKR
jgi:hypothetical protein